MQRYDRFRQVGYFFVFFYVSCCDRGTKLRQIQGTMPESVARKEFVLMLLCLKRSYVYESVLLSNTCFIRQKAYMANTISTIKQTLSNMSGFPETR